MIHFCKIKRKEGKKKKKEKRKHSPANPGLKTLALGNTIRRNLVSKSVYESLHVFWVISPFVCFLSEYLFILLESLSLCLMHSHSLFSSCTPSLVTSSSINCTGISSQTLWLAVNLNQPSHYTCLIFITFS